ncbi:MAG TPA: YceI family protein [Steroidobacteraceae bacterium]|nr:YceI family protein [Steroidobacteraceae bacterium]
MKKLLALALVSAVCSSAAVRAAETTYSIDPNHTHATFAFQHLGFSTFHGKVPARTGTIALDRAAKTGRVEVEFDPNAVATGVPKFEEHLRGADFFEVAKHPTATFKSSQVTFENDVPKEVVGNLTIKGITRPVTLQVRSFHCADHPMAKVPACGANATAAIKRSDYGMSYALPAVPDEIALEIEVEAMQKK